MTRTAPVRNNHHLPLFAAAVLLISLILLPWPAFAASALLKEVPINAAAIAALRGRPFTLTLNQRRWVVPPAQVSLWFKTRPVGDVRLLQLRPGAIYDYLNVSVSPSANEPGKNSRFKTVNGAVQLIQGGTKGRIVDGTKTSLAIRDALVAGKTTATVAIQEHRPSIFSASDFQKLSFPDILASATTNFAGSPRNRIHNITVGAARFDGLTLLPGEEFSFNRYLGAVDAENGYLPELVIKDNVTTPEFGGGICQVSTTAFQGAMRAGMKITARRNHAYPVRYYGTPGFDATVYSPATDLRFVNDTGSPVHLTTTIVGSRLTFAFRGTSAGRTVTINGPFVTGKKPDGSITAAVAQIIKQGSKTIREQNFVSHYQSPDKFPIIRDANKG